MAKYVVEIKDRDALKPKLVGNKAKNLAELARKGFLVPPFFCITTRAFSDFLASVDIRGHTPAEIRDIVLSSPIPEPIVREIERAYHKWKQVPLAVRSSATSEDAPDVSWAGQLDSLLWIEGFEDLLEAIKKCWGSLWKENVIIYCKNRAIPHDRINLAVIVQQMIPGELSGVAFTADPTTGEERVIIEPKLEEGLGHRLSSLVKSIERYYRFPQDVEWVYHRGKFYILQARPITTIKPVWTRAFFDERFPHPVSPLGWSILGDLVKQRAFIDPLRYLGYENPEELEVFRLIRSRPYVLVEVFQALYRHFPPFLRPSDWERYFPNRNYPERRLYLLKMGSPLRRLWCVGSNLVRDTNWILPLHYRNWKAFLRGYLKELKDVQSQDKGILSDGELKCILQQLRSMVDRFLQIHRWSITWAEVLCGVLGRLTRERSTLLNLIVSSRDKTSEINYALWRLAQQRDVQKGLRDFLEAYGHRANSLDISFPTWEEDPQFVLDLVKGYTSCPDPSQREREALQRQGQTLELLSRKLNFLGRALLWLVLTWARRMVLLREEQRFYWQMTMAEIRKVFLEFGNRFVIRKLIDKPQDIFFLTLDEFHQVLDGKSLEIKGLILERKRRKQADENQLPPPFVVGSRAAEVELSHRGKVLRGMGISPGRVEGKASVIPDMRDYPRIASGRILVTTTVDPGWTPILINLSGLVLETGGALSHGAIVARELGLPAVANVKGATRLIPPEARIAVNGDSGEVVILE